MGDFGVGYAHGYLDGNDDQYVSILRMKSNTMMAKFVVSAVGAMRNNGWMFIITLLMSAVVFGYATMWLCGNHPMFIGVSVITTAFTAAFCYIMVRLE